MSGSNGHNGRIAVSNGRLRTLAPKPETGVQPQDGPKPRRGRGKARLQEGQDSQRKRAEDPIAKFARVWSGEQSPRIDLPSRNETPSAPTDSPLSELPAFRFRRRGG
jgi:hypothetical protein